MPVTMMHIGEMNVFVDNGIVRMWVAMWLDAVPLKIVSVLVVLVMAVSVSMVDGVVSVLMFVLLGEMQPNPGRHERSRGA